MKINRYEKKYKYNQGEEELRNKVQQHCSTVAPDETDPGNFLSN
jgi:hypothetical protein